MHVGLTETSMCDVVISGTRMRAEFTRVTGQNAKRMCAAFTLVNSYTPGRWLYPGHWSNRHNARVLALPYSLV